MPRTRKTPVPPVTSTSVTPPVITFTSTTLAPTKTQEALGDLAAKLRVGQICTFGGCNQPAYWSAVAPSEIRFACRPHLGELLDHDMIWFLHPVG